ncbi:hypothetical protein [Candidatus Methanocrinis natronophilus]|uniref:Uncharacterized protein n=1 Tax=Candidatus Methanocrinis natronophilus TaxID=3033396 RepID=A0ABT5X520_9EURY|nr:hypothetical protein [Candidatus Methanocrinis natronophilus]MDF0589775.1 hypothetical protein [Candidatus Methanocrinis natronophilus]
MLCDSEIEARHERVSIRRDRSQVEKRARVVDGEDDLDNAGFSLLTGMEEGDR